MNVKEHMQRRPSYTSVCKGCAQVFWCKIKDSSYYLMLYVMVKC